MATIPGIAFILVGVILSFSSNYINKSNDSNTLVVFVYIGYLFIAYGIAKVLIKYILKKQDSEPQLPEKKTDIKDTISKHKKDLYGYIGYCPGCGTPMRKINIYCHRCGRKQ